MALKARLDLRQTQNLVMTPQLQQAIRLLQFSSQELTAFVDAEIQQNPLLEPDTDRGDFTRPGDDSLGNGAEGRDDRPATTGDDSAAPIAADSPQGVAEQPLDVAPDALFDGEGEIAANGAPGWSETIGGHRGGGWEGDTPDALANLAEPEELRDRLMVQLQLDIPDPHDRLIGAHLIDLLDDSGYLRADLTALAERLGCSTEEIEAVRQQLLRFEPTGLFARDLGECLALQLAERNRYDPAMATLLDNLDLLARRDWNGLMRRCGVDMDDLRDMVAEIRSLDPKPGQTHGAGAAEPVIPDVLMRRHPAGGWIVELNTDALPRVLINESYYTEVTNRLRDKEARSYLAEQFQNANWLVRALHQRATTILKVASEIVRQQDAFFTKGVAHLRPLVLRDIAAAIDMHESTVSRVTSNKFIASPRGLFELKYFFTAAIPSAGGGDAHSAEAVRHRIRQLVDAETAESVLSDDKLVALLKREGIDIARRTVAKYREAMRIPSSVQRRREKRAQGL